MTFKEALNTSPPRIASALWARIGAHCFVVDARHRHGDGCALLLALHPKSRRTASPGRVQRFLKQWMPRRWRSAWSTTVACVALALTLTACDKSHEATRGLARGDPAVGNPRYLYVIDCDGRVDKLDMIERKKISSFALTERAGSTSGAPVIPSPEGAAGRMDGCVAQRAQVDPAGATVSLIAPKGARVDAEGLQEFQVLTFTLPQWTLTGARPAGRSAEAPWLVRDTTGTLQVRPDNPLLTAPAPDVQALTGADADAGGVLLQSSANGLLLSLLFKNTKAFVPGLANTETRTLTRLTDLPPTAQRFVHLAPGGGFVLVEAVAPAVPHRRTGALRLYDATGRAVADVVDERLRQMEFVALTPNGLAVYAAASGEYHFVSLGKTFAAAVVVTSPLVFYGVAPPPDVVFAQQ